MIDQEVLFEKVPYDQHIDWLDLAQYGWEPSQPGIGRGKLITFLIQSDDLEFDPATPGWYVNVHGEMVPGEYVSGHELSVGIGEQALWARGIKFALPSNVDRYIRFTLLGAYLSGTYTVYAVLE